MGAKPLLAVVFLTWKASIRFRFFWVMLFLLALAVGVLPLIVKDDGSAAGMTQILITYTLSMITAIMGASTLWISAGSLANEIENHQLQMVVTKPIPRWQIWLGKWIGVMSMNFILLLFAGGIVFGMIEYRANKLTWDELKRMENRSDLDIALETVRSGWGIFEQDPENPKEPKSTTGPQPLLGQLSGELGGGFRQSIVKFEGTHGGKEPLLRSVNEMREDLAGIEEKKLRGELLVARASIPMTTEIGRGKMNLSNTNAPPVFREDPLETWIEQQVKGYWPKREAQLLAAKNEMERKMGIKPGDLSQELDSFERMEGLNGIREEIRGYSQILNPEEGLVFRFKKPRGWNPDEGERFAMRFYFEDTQVAYKHDRLYPFFFELGPGNQRLFRDAREFDARKIHEVLMSVSVPTNEEGKWVNMFDTNNVMSIAMYNGGQARLKVPYLDSRGRMGGEGIEMVYRETGFTTNYFRGLGIVFAWLGALAALGLFAGSFMSFEMSAFTCLGILVVIGVLGLAEDVVDEGTVMQTYSEGQRDKSYVDSFAVPALKVIVTLVKPIKDYSPIEKLTEGRSITWMQLIRAYAYIWGLSGLILGFLGSYILSSRQLALTSADGGGDSFLGTESLIVLLAVFVGMLLWGLIGALIVGIIGVAFVLYYKFMRNEHEKQV